MDDSHYQTFRTKSSSEVVTIPTLLDPKSGQRVVRWKDIQQYFKDAQGILNGKYSVLFLTDDDLEDLIPLRIAHHPDVVLEVIVADTPRGYPGSADILGFNSGCPVSHTKHLEHNQKSLRTSGSLHGTYAPQYTPASRTDQHERDDPERLLSETGGNIGQQDQLGQLKQQTQQMQRQIEEILKRTASMQQEMVEIEQYAEITENQNRRQFQQQIDDMTQKLQQLQEWVNETDQGNPLTLDQIRGEFSRQQLETLNRHIFMHDRVQAILGDLSGEPSAPRLFFILPKDINQDVGEDHATNGPSSRLFRLYFLCECGSHTMSKGSKEAHEVHMTYHAGYDLKRPKAFFDKYGSYILTMMYMVKYGAMAAGYVVPPLLQSKRAGMIEQGQEQDRVAKEDIERLINDTITYLKEMNHDTDSDTNNQGWNVVHADLSDVKSYLEVNEGDPFPGGIHQLTRLEQRCSWVCEEHQYEWNLKYLRDVVNAMGGTYIEKPGNIDIKVNLGSVPKPFYDVIIEFCTIQCAKDRQLLTIDCGRLSLTTDGTQDVVMNIKRLSDLTTDDIDFIRQCSPNKLSIEYTPMKADENRLINILHQTLNLEELRIGCLAERSRAVINFIVSTRELAIQEGKLAALHTFELMEEELRPVKYDRMWDGLDHISATLTFSEDSAKVDVDTRVVMQTSKDLTEQDWICSFIRQYGWSISRLETATRFNDHLAALLDDSTQIHGSKLTALVLSQYSLTAIGMDAMDRVVKRSRGLTYFKAILARLQKPFQPEKVAPFLERFGARLNKLQLIGNIVERWLPAVRGNLPLLDELAVGCYTKHPFPHACLSWLVSMVSAPPRSSDSSVRLKILNLSNLNLIPQDWEALIKAVDYSVMLELKFNETNFARKQLDLMLESITSTGEESVPLEYLDIWNTDLVRNADKDALHERIQKVVPRVKILSL